MSFDGGFPRLGLSVAGRRRMQGRYGNKLMLKPVLSAVSVRSLDAQTPDNVYYQAACVRAA